MGRSDFYKKGDYNVVCDVCNFKYKASALKKRWDGFMTCHRCWEPRNAQDFVRGVKDTQSLPWTRPEPPDTFI